MKVFSILVSCRNYLGKMFKVIFERSILIIIIVNHLTCEDETRRNSKNIILYLLYNFVY